MARKTEKVVLLDQLAAIAAGFEKASLLASRFAADYERLVQERVVCGRGQDPTLRTLTEITLSCVPSARSRRKLGGFRLAMQATLFRSRS